MKILNKNIGLSSKPYVIAEMSGNHNQSLQVAMEMVDAASRSGVDAIKLQTYTADTMTLNSGGNEFTISDKRSPWDGQKLYDLYQKASTPWEWHRAIMERAALNGLACFSSPFDETAVDFLEELGVPAYKIASFECIDLPLIKRVAKTKKPLIISTGMATISEIAEAVEAARENGCADLALLKCTSTYPASPENTNLKTIPNMRDLFGCEVGLSDHTLGTSVAIASIAFGATIVEKHFTLSRANGGVDSIFSLEPIELKSLSEGVQLAWSAIGTINYGPTSSEEGSLARRRSIYVVKDLKGGDVLSEDNLQRVRPGLGLKPKFYEIVLGRRVNKDIKKGTPLSWDMFH